MAAPTFFGSASNPADTGTGVEPSTIAVTPPGSMVSGDLAVLIAQYRLNSTAGQATVSATGGQSWSAASEISTSAGLQDLTLFWCQYNGTWSADPSIAFAAMSGTIPCTVAMLVFRPNVVGTWAVDTTIAGGNEASADPIVVTGITPNNDDNVTVAIVGISTQRTLTAVSGGSWTLATFGGVNQVRNLTGSDQTLFAAYQLQGTKGATSNASFDLSAADPGGSCTMAWNNVVVSDTLFAQVIF